MKEASMFGKLVALFVALIPFVVSHSLFSGSVNAKYFFIVGVLTVVFVYVTYVLASGKHTLSLRGRWLLGLLGLVLAAQYLSAVTGVHLGASFMSDILRSTGVVFLTYLTLFAWFLSELFTEDDWKLVRRAIIWPAGLYALFTFFSPQGFGATGQFLTVDFETNALSLGNTTFGGAFLLITFAITLIELARAETKKERYTFGILALIQLLSPLLLSFGLWTGEVSLTSPIALLGEARASSATAWMLVVFLFGLWGIRKLFSGSTHRTAAFAWSGIWLIGIFTAVAMLFTPGSVVQDTYIESSTAARIIVWEDAASAIKERPVLGWGPENFRLAHDGHIDARLYLKENIGETWFDRAHNIIIDTLTSVGVLGALMMLVFVVYFILIVRRAHKQKLIGYGEAAILGILPFAHFLQLQTSFDTVITYTLQAIVIGYVLWLERKMTPDKEVSSTMQKVIAGLLLAFTLIGSWHMLIREFGRQQALFALFSPTPQRTVGEQVEIINRALDDTTSFEALRLSSMSYVKGFLAAIQQEGLTDEQRGLMLQSGMRQMEVYEEHYQEWLERVPSDYRARMNYTYMLLIATALGNDRIADAQEQVDLSYDLSPENPMTYVMDGLVQLYQGDLTGAEEKIDEAYMLVPGAPFTENIVEYLERQKEQFPRISVINLEKL